MYNYPCLHIRFNAINSLPHLEQELDGMKLIINGSNYDFVFHLNIIFFGPSSRVVEFIYKIYDFPVFSHLCGSKLKNYTCGVNSHSQRVMGFIRKSVFIFG